MQIQPEKVQTRGRVIDGIKTPQTTVKSKTADQSVMRHKSITDPRIALKVWYFIHRGTCRCAIVP